MIIEWFIGCCCVCWWYRVKTDVKVEKDRCYNCNRYNSQRTLTLISLYVLFVLYNTFYLTFNLFNHTMKLLLCIVPYMQNRWYPAREIYISYHITGYWWLLSTGIWYLNSSSLYAVITVYILIDNLFSFFVWIRGVWNNCIYRSKCKWWNILMEWVSMTHTHITWYIYISILDRRVIGTATTLTASCSQWNVILLYCIYDIHTYHIG